MCKEVIPRIGYATDLVLLDGAMSGSLCRQQSNGPEECGEEHGEWLISQGEDGKIYALVGEKLRSRPRMLSTTAAW